MKYILLCIITATVTFVGTTKHSYKGFRMFKITPVHTSAVSLLENLRLSGLGEFWDDIIRVNLDVQINVAPEDLQEFLNFLIASNITSEEIMMDVQSVIDQQLRPAQTRTSMESNRSYFWDEYHNLNEIYAWLNELQKNYPHVVKIVDKGQSVLGNSIKGVVINYHPTRANKLIGVLEGTLHAREWICPAILTWIIKEFLTSTDPAVRDLAEKFEWHIFPVINPDGYNYTFLENRMWRKNRNPFRFTTCPGRQGREDMSIGVDLNRNFDFHWRSTEPTSNPCSNSFRGLKPFSEPESRAVRDYILKINSEGKLIYYIGFHSYGQLILVPYSHVTSDKSLLTNNYGDMFAISLRTAEAMKKRYGTKYRVGLSSSIVYPMSGSSFDWVKRVTNIPVSLLFELRDRGEYGFLLPADQIVPNSMEVMDGLIVMDLTTKRMGYYSNSNKELLSSVTVVLGVFTVLLG